MAGQSRQQRHLRFLDEAHSFVELFAAERALPQGGLLQQVRHLRQRARVREGADVLLLRQAKAAQAHGQPEDALGTRARGCVGRRRVGAHVQ